MEQTNEIWKPVVGFETIYQVSNTGKVRSIERKVRSRYGNYRICPAKNISACNGRGGYQILTLHKENKRYSVKVHRLVAEAFIPNPNHYPQVNHKDENVRNNNVSNLEWCDQTYNNNYGTRSKKTSLVLLCRKDESQKVIGISVSSSSIVTFDSIREAHRKGFDRTAVNKCCHFSYTVSNTNIYKGFRWYFKEQWDTLTQEEQERLMNH